MHIYAYMYVCVCVCVCIYIYIYRQGRARHRLNEYFAQRVPSCFLASSFRMCVNCGVLKGMFPWRTRYPLSWVPIKPVPKERPVPRTRTS